MKKNQRGFSVLTILFVLFAIAIVGLVGWLVWSRQSTPVQQNAKSSKTQNITDGQRVSYTGKVDSVDISAMPTDGDGVYLVKTSGGQITVHLSSGESPCDRTAIAIPEVVVGDTVTVNGDKGDDGVVRVCETGTYITAQKSASKTGTVSVTLLDKTTSKPIANENVSIYSDNGVRCIQAPCPTNGKTWGGKSDAKGVLLVPQENIQSDTTLSPATYQAAKLLYDEVKTSYTVEFEP